MRSTVLAGKWFYYQPEIESKHMKLGRCFYFVNGLLLLLLSIDRVGKVCNPPNTQYVF